MFLLVAAIATSLNIMALTPTATAVITMTGNVSGNFDRVTLVESTTDGFTAGYENGYDVFQPDANVPGIYAVSEAGRFSTSMTNNLDNNPIGFIAGTDAAYTLTFSGVSGRTLKIYDKETHTETVLANDGNYPFAATPGARIDNRFVINYAAPTPVEFEICFRDNQLQITANPYAENVVVKDANDTKVVDVAPVTPYQAIDLSAQAAGRYTVELAGGARKFIIVKQ